MREAIRTGKAMMVDFDQLPEERRRVADAYPAHNALLVPLVYGERVTGVVIVDDPGGWAAFADEERHLVEAIAAQAAVAIENARLYEAQKSIADQLQTAILDVPDAVPGLEFGHLYRSATDEAIVGGDFYDVFERPDGSIVLLAGDVSGHGVEAARLASTVKASLAAFSLTYDEPGEVLENVNRLLMRKRVPGFTTVLLAVYRPAKAELHYCSAGHPNLLIADDDGRATFVGKNHTPLGIFPHWTCAADTLEVHAGQTLLLYTDGLLEARASNDLFGEERLAKAFAANADLPVVELPQALLAEVLDHSGGELRDDVAILAVRILPC
jgi:serine phosphatase RsbU (regulator of sigma subunit)